MPTLGFICALVSTLFIVGGDLLIKLAADRNDGLLSMSFAIGCALYGFAAVGWYLALQNLTLGQAAVAFSMFTMIALCAAGVIFFGERLMTRELLGIGCAVASMLLMIRMA